MDARIKNKMRTFLHKDKYNNRYRIGICYSVVFENNKPKYKIIFIGSSRIDDFLGANFSYFVNLVYNKVLKSLSISPYQLSWYQYYPGNNGFKDTCEEVIMDWDEQTEKYTFFIRKTIKNIEIEKLIDSMRTI